MGLRNHDRRYQTRLLCSEIVRVSWTDDAGCPWEQIANLEDVSSCGACLLTDDPVPVGTTMVITCHADDFMAKVRHCTQQVLGWLVGVEFEPDSQWGSAVDTLDLLVDPTLVGGIIKSDKHHRKHPDLLGMISCMALGSALKR